MRFSAMIEIQTEDRSYMTRYYLQQQLPFYVESVIESKEDSLIRIKAKSIKAPSWDESLNLIEDAIGRVLDDYRAEVRLLRTDLEAYDKFDISNKGSIVSGS